MEEDPTPVPSVGLRKHLITNDEGVITGEETSVDLGHTESGQVPWACVCACSPEVDVCFSISISSTRVLAASLSVVHVGGRDTPLCAFW